jgi:hypothetical protein
MINYVDSSSPQNLVTLILKNIRLENVSTNNIDRIKGIGAYEGKVSDKTVWILDYVDEHELAKKLHELNILGFLFVGEPAGWPPAAIFDHLREKKLLDDNFKEVTWRGPGDWVVIER